MQRDSMFFWWPKVKGLVPAPKTVLVRKHVSPRRAADIDAAVKKVQAAIDEVGLPVFIRTDHLSGKHDWKNTCFFDGSDELRNHIAMLCDYSWGCDMIGLRVSGFVVREYVRLDSAFTAFWGDMPVARERRFFVADGAVLCHHPYWVEDAIRNPSIPDWRVRLGELNDVSDEELILLSQMASRLSRRLPGYWSLDFARTVSGQWLFIDAAVGEHSWHPSCPVAVAHPFVADYFERDPI